MNDDRKNERRPVYEKPAILWEQSLDVRALAVACGKADETVGHPCAESGSITS